MSRVSSVDAVRVAAVFAVVTIHTSPFGAATAGAPLAFDLGAILGQLARFAVPCFFILSGYFWSVKCAQDGAVAARSIKMGKRLLVLFLAWSLFYLLPRDLYQLIHEHGYAGLLKGLWWNISSVAREPFKALLQGSCYHLWYLSSLLSCLIVSAALLHLGQRRLLYALAVLFFLIALATGAYAPLLGIRPDFNFRNGPFFGLLFFLSGDLLRVRGVRTGDAVLGATLFVVGSMLTLLESWWLINYGGVTELPYAVLATLMTGVGAALVALSGHPAVSAGPLAFAGPMVLGLYAVHIFFVDLLRPLDRAWTGNAGWEIAYPLIVFALALGATYALSRRSATRALVM